MASPSASAPASAGFGEHSVPSSATYWPLADSAAFERVPRQWRHQLANELEADLDRHVIQTWFPRSVDPVRGGFLCDFDGRWRPNGMQLRMLEFQARQTRTAARLGLAYPNDGKWPEIALHGLRYLRETLYDSAHGGWFSLLDADGSPLANATKHAHGTAYLLDAGVEVYRLTHEPGALYLAQEAFEWLETSLHDDVNGGYHGWATREGIKITEADANDARLGDIEPLGHDIGLKDANVHSDLMEAFALLSGVWLDGRVSSRLAEVYDIVMSRFLTSSGAMHYVTTPTFEAVPTLERFGYPFQTAFRLPSAAIALRASVDDAFLAARRAVKHAMARGWDPHRGGVIEAGPASAPYVLSGTSLRVGLRPWWVQSESLKANLLLGLLDGEGSTSLATFERGLEVVSNEFLDRRYGGWYFAARSDLPRSRWRMRRTIRKGDAWKDASHEADFYLAAIRMLRGLPETAPLGAANALAGRG